MDTVGNQFGSTPERAVATCASFADMLSAGNFDQSITQELGVEQRDCCYCRSIPHVGPQSRESAAGPYDVILAKGPNAVVTPTIGMLVPGYLLAITFEHVDSLAALGKFELSRFEEWLTSVTLDLEGIFGSYILFEHGSGGEFPGSRSGGCIRHAHLHLIPAPVDLARSIIGSLSFRDVGNLTDIAGLADSNYALLGFGGRWLVADGIDLPSQWIRKEVARALGRPDQYDWALFPGESSLTRTLSKLQRWAGTAEGDR